MRNRSKLVLAGLTAALALGAFIGAASANRFAFSNRSFRVVWSALRISGGPMTIECRVTIEGSFHSRTLSKVAEQLVGYVTRAMIDEATCTGGSARILPADLPWHIRYGSFAGTLPLITEIDFRFLGAAFDVSTSNENCLYMSTQAQPLVGVAYPSTTPGQVGQVEAFAASETSPLPLSSGSMFCSGSSTVAGITTSFTLLGNTTKITVTLVQ